MKGGVGRGLIYKYIVRVMFGGRGIVIIQGAELKGTEGIGEAKDMGFI